MMIENTFSIKSGFGDIFDINFSSLSAKPLTLPETEEVPKQMKLFVADDSEFVRQRLKERLIEIEGLEIVGEAANVIDAARIINALEPDVIILDLRMPGGNTLALLKTLRTQPHPPITIIYTSFSYPQYREAYISAGADYFFDKTKDTDQLIEVIQNLVQTHCSN